MGKKLVEKNYQLQNSTHFEDKEYALRMESKAQCAESRAIENHYRGAKWNPY